MKLKHLVCAAGLLAVATASLTIDGWRDGIFAATTVHAAASKLGDLGGFKAIVVDTQCLAEKGDLAGAKVSIKDLETQWDEVQAGLKPQAAADWQKIDKAIDRAAEALRASTPAASDCKVALADLLQTTNSMR